MTLALSSDTLPLSAVQDPADTRLVQKISQIPGVGLVSLRGGARPPSASWSIRGCWRRAASGWRRCARPLPPPTRIRPRGASTGRSLAYALETNGQLRTADEYAQLVLSAQGSALVRLGDVATLSEGVEDAYLGAWANGAPAILLSVQRQPGSNVIAIVDRIRQIMPSSWRRCLRP